MGGHFYPIGLLIVLVSGINSCLHARHTLLSVFVVKNALTAGRSMITKLTYKTSVCISERTRCISIVKRDILMLCREIISIYFENPTNHMYTGKICTTHSNGNVTAGCTYSYY